jgi:hypothetical protein
VRALLGLTIAATMLGFIDVNSADAGYLGACRYRGCDCRCSTCPDDCQQHSCVVMKLCPEVVYEEHQCTAYKTEYVDVVDKKEVPAVKYVEEVQYELRPTTIWQPQQCECSSCAPPAGACEAAQPPKLVPVQCVQKVPNTVLKPVKYQKTEETSHVEIRQVPYTVTCYTSKVVYKEVPVTVCCPTPCCKAD